MILRLNRYDNLLHGRGLWFKSRIAQLRQSNSIDLVRGDIAQLVERRPCNWVVVLTGWMPNYLGGSDSIYYPN